MGFWTIALGIPMAIIAWTLAIALACIVGYVLCAWLT